jgi:hypothetical protein
VRNWRITIIRRGPLTSVGAILPPAEETPAGRIDPKQAEPTARVRSRQEPAFVMIDRQTRERD